MEVSEVVILSRWPGAGLIGVTFVPRLEGGEGVKLQTSGGRGS